MYDITKRRMLLTTAVFAAVAALSASGANAMIPADGGSAYGAQESLRIGAYAAQSPSWWGKGGKGEETGGATNPLQQAGGRSSRTPHGQSDPTPDPHAHRAQTLSCCPFDDPGGPHDARPKRSP